MVRIRTLVVTGARPPQKIPKDRRFKQKPQATTCDTFDSEYRRNTMGSMEIAFLLLTGSFAATFCNAFTTSPELRSLSVPFSFHASNDALVQGDLSDALVGWEPSLSAASFLNEGAVFDSVASMKAADAASSIPMQPPSILTASSLVDNGKTLTLYEYVLSGGSAVSDGEGDSRLANAQDKFGLINDNLNSFLRDLNLPDSNDVAALLKQAFEKGVGAITSIGDGSGSDFKVQFAAMSSGLSLEQNAAWFAAGVALFLALGQRGAGKADARSEFEAELAGAKKKADEAAGAAALAAKGAAIAKEVASQIEPQPKKSDGTASSTMLENSRLRQMSVETVSLWLFFVSFVKFVFLTFVFIFLSIVFTFYVLPIGGSPKWTGNDER